MFCLLQKFAFVLLLNRVFCVDYCKLSCEIDGKIYKNSACNRKDCSTKSECKLKLIPMTHSIRAIIMNQYAHVRENVANMSSDKSRLGKASNMELMLYDLDLEHTAQCNIQVYDCKFEHDKCRTTKQHKSVGQDMWKIPTTEKVEEMDFIKLASVALRKGWMKLFAWIIILDGENIHSPNAPEELQMINGQTNRVGCGIFAADYEFSLVCNYGPAFLENQTELFKNGPPCSACPSNQICDPIYKVFCMTPDEEIEEKSSLTTPTTTAIYHSQQNADNHEEETTSLSFFDVNATNTTQKYRYRSRTNGSPLTKASTISINFFLAFISAYNVFIFELL